MTPGFSLSSREGELSLAEMGGPWKCSHSPASGVDPAPDSGT